MPDQRKHPQERNTSLSKLGTLALSHPFPPSLLSPPPPPPPRPQPFVACSTEEKEKAWHTIGISLLY